MKSVDLKGLLQLAADAPTITAEPIGVPLTDYPVRIGVAKDEAFNFYYEDNFDFLRRFGVQWVPFSPLHDAALPENLGGIYIGGGFPEVFAEKLSLNAAMLGSISHASESGIPIFAECGGYMYLMDAIKTFDGVIHPMTGILSGTAAMTKRLQRFGYVAISLAADSLFGPAGTRLKGHEFHRSVREGIEIPVPAYLVTKGRQPHETWTCGENTGNVLAAYAHIHWMSNPQAALNFVKACSMYQHRISDREEHE